MADVKIHEEEKACAETRKVEVPNPAYKTSVEKNEAEDKAESNKRQKLEISDERYGKSENISASAVEENDEDDDEEDYEEEEDEDEEAAAPVDMKGKGIMIDDKGKGEMAVYDDEDEDDDNDSSEHSDSDCSDGLDDDSDVEDNPLAALDMDNILPSRTRQSRAQPGLRISDDRDNNSDA